MWEGRAEGMESTFCLWPVRGRMGEFEGKDGWMLGGDLGVRGKTVRGSGDLSGVLLMGRVCSRVVGEM